MPITWTAEALLKRNLWIITGKGGVGKTSVTAALGLMAAKAGRKVLLVETHGLCHLGDLFEVGRANYTVNSIEKNLNLIQLNSEAAFEEYVLRQIKWKLVYDRLFNNKYVKHFIEATPGLAELLTIGKIWSLVEEKKKRNHSFDLVILDAPSTGHAMALLTIAQTVVNAVRIGPLHSQSNHILDLLRDSQRTLAWLVTLPEEMPVNEAIEMKQRLTTQAQITLGPVLVNSMWPSLLSTKTQAELEKSNFTNETLKRNRERLDQCEFYFNKLRSELNGEEILKLPLVHKNQKPRLIAEALMKSIEEQLKAS